MDTPINQITDTAFWIAAFRAQESARHDAVFKDPLAAKLAGEKGAKIIKATPKAHLMAFAMVMRTAGIDRLVAKAVEKGVDTVINLGAGLDTRPYRLELPESLHWIEVDYHEIINYKNEKLKDDKPVCRLTRISADLSPVPQRKALFGRLAGELANALIITEGLIGYLTTDEAASLAGDLHEIPAFRYWIMDFSQGSAGRRRRRKRLNKILKNTPFKFTERNQLGFFEKLGWRSSEIIYILDQAAHSGRRLPTTFPWNWLAKIFPRLIRRLANRTYGYVMLER
jgi:methyltransferase (TIGR00027 family)